MAHERDSNRRSAHSLLYQSVCSAVLLLLLFMQSNAAAADAEHEYVGHLKCKTCHSKVEIGNQYDE